MTIELAQRIENNQRMHLKSTLPVFAPASVMASALQMTATSFVAQTQDPINKRINNPKDPDLKPALINSSNLLIKNNKIMAHLYCNNSLLPPPVPRNNNNQNNRIINNNVLNQRFNYANINFFKENFLVEATNKSASQPEENLFYAFNLTDDDHDIDELTINTSESTRKMKKAKIDFILDLKKASTSTANNNEPPKAKVFKNSSKLKFPKIVQKSGPYSVVKDLMKTSKKTPKTNKHLCQAGLADNSNVTLLICKVQVTGYFIDLILDSGLSVSVIAKHFLETIGKKINQLFTRPMTNVHGDKKKVLKQSQEKEQSDESDDEKSDKKDEQKKQEETTELVYTIFTSNGKLLDNVKADKEGIMVNGKLICWPYYDILRRTFNRKSGKKAKYSYWWHGLCVRCWCDKFLYFPSNEYKSCLIYYKDWEPINLILREELKEVQKFFENKPPEIQLPVVEQRESSLEEKKVNIENLLARNSPVISKESDTPG
ncbi:hypothetical protein G9A89_009468 [Geosiphon pyriformis]|nr:hypothetical protein G9A89_009468 [Geosiphon pyriformis]